MTDWTKLRHAYGRAGDVPKLLSSLAPDCDEEIWDKLWASLCHQGTVYSASFAALPALTEAAERWKRSERTRPLLLAAAILASDDIQGQRDTLLMPVADVIPRLRKLSLESLAQTGKARTDFIYLLQATRAFHGDNFWGQHLDHLATGELPGECPYCGANLFLVIGEYGFFTTTEDWVNNSKAKRTPIKPNRGKLSKDGEWLHQQAHRARQHEVAEWILYVFGTSTCPKCARRLSVSNSIAAWAK